MTLLVVGSVATALMVTAYALEQRSYWFIGLLSVASAVVSGYSFAVEAWPVGAVEAIWAVVAAYRFRVTRSRVRAVDREMGEQETGAEIRKGYEMAELPIACDMDALGTAERERHGELVATLREAKGVEAVEDGYVLSFPADDAVFQRLAEWVTLERRCCPFLRFELRLSEEDDVVELGLRGREGVRAFLTEELGIA
jgi:hypothetical protein